MRHQFAPLILVCYTLDDNTPRQQLVFFEKDDKRLQFYLNLWIHDSYSINGFPSVQDYANGEMS